MSSPLERYARVKDIVTRARSLPPEARAPFVADACEGDSGLRQEVEALLGHDVSLEVLQTAAFGMPMPAVTVPAATPDTIGPYRVEGVLGEGGMGVVYRAVQDVPLHRVVALKVIRRGMDSARIVARFAVERQMLAVMNHPNIARIFEAGATADGQPFFAMELVDGVPITRYANEHRMNLQARLELFTDVCQGVKHAHQKGVIHRDLKPSNVLVTTEDERPLAKIIDFGIAKAMHVAGEDLSAGVRGVGTPSYMSPEQAGVTDAPVDTRTDVYALGVLLYELLTGRPPWRFESGTPAELYRVLRETTAERPSAVAGQTAGVRPRELAGDLDSIVLKAIEVEPGRRYQSVEQLVDDLDRYREKRPVEARAATWSYRARKFVGRNRVASAAALVFTTTVVAFSGLALWQARTIATERDAAVAAEARARANAAFLAGLFRTANPREAGNRNATAYDMLVAGVEQLESDETLDARVRADLGLTLGRALANLDRFDAGVPALRRSLADSVAAYGRDSLETAEHLHRLGDVLRMADQVDEAYALMTEALDIRRRHLPTETYEIADSYNNLAILASQMGRYVESERLQRESIAIHERLTGPRSEEVAVPLNNLGLLMRRQGRYEDALELATRSWEIQKDLDDQYAALLARQNMADSIRAMGRVAEAEAIYRELLDAGRPLLGPDHSMMLNFENLLAQCRRDLGDRAGAARLFEELEARTRRVAGDEVFGVAVLLRHRGNLERDFGNLESAENLLRQALERHLALTDARHFGIPTYRRSLADVLIDRGKFEEAESQLQTALDLLPPTAEYPYVERALTLMSFARLLQQTGRPDEAAAALAEAERAVAATTGPDSPEMQSLRALNAR